MSIAKSFLLVAALAVATVQATNLETLLALIADSDADRCLKTIDGKNATLQYLNTTWLTGPTSDVEYFFSFCSQMNVTTSAGTVCGGKGYFSELTTKGTTCSDNNTVQLLMGINYDNATKSLLANYSSTDARTMLRLSVTCNETATRNIRALSNVTRTQDGMMSVFWAYFESPTVCPGYLPTTTPAPTPAPPEIVLSTGAIVGIVVGVVIVGVVIVAICRKRGPSNDDTRQSNSPYKPMDKV